MVQKLFILAFHVRNVQRNCTSIDKADSQTSNEFKHAWLNCTNWLLCFVETEEMYCLVCKTHHMKHPQNQREVFAASPSIRFKIDALNTHVKSKIHCAAVESGMLQQVSVFHHEVTKKAQVEMDVLENVFSSAYFLMKEFIANRKLIFLM